MTRRQYSFTLPYMTNRKITCKHCGTRYEEVAVKVENTPSQRRYYGGKKYHYWFESNHACEAILKRRAESTDHFREVFTKFNEIFSKI